MIPRRLAHAARTLALTSCLVVGWSQGGGPVVRADDGPVARPVGDPWPLAGASPSKDAGAARAAIDAVDARRHALALARVAAALGSVDVSTEAETPNGPGRVTLSPAIASQGLRGAAARAQTAASRTVPEMAQVLAAAAFDGGAVSPERPVLPGALGTVDRVFKGRFVPMSIDDRPYVLRPNRISDLRTAPPPLPTAPPVPTAAPKKTTGHIADLIVRGVRIDVDEALLRRALAAPGAPPESDALDALEGRLLAASDGDAAVATLATFAAERKQALFAARAGAGGLVRVSLKALLATTPGPDATVGRLTRLLGVSREGASGDVTLIGIEEPGAEAIPLDALALAMKSVWREGRVPGCSLDPDPSMPSGPQKVRVFGVPGDSRFAKTMLEADYMMKRVVGRTPGAPTGFDGLVDLPEAIRRTDTAVFTSSRFWLTPAPPGPGDVLTSKEGGCVLFEARVRIRTEEMHTAAAGGEAGTGAAAAASSVCAKSMSERYDVLAERIPEFRRLRALFDVVTCARILRLIAPKHALLDRLADVAYVKADVPATYAGITVTHQLDGHVITLMGGCELDAKLNRRAFLDVVHPAFEALASGGGDGALPGPRPAPPGGSDGSVEDGMLAASAMLAAGKHLDAEYLLSDLLDVAPDDPELLSMRGVARARGGHADAGILDAVEAAALDPASMTLAATVRYLRNEAGDATAFEALPGPVAEVLEATYLTIAGQEALAHKFVEALASAGSALKARPGSTSAKLVHATLLMLTGETRESAREAAEVANADPTSVDARMLGALVALRVGDVRSARDGFERASVLRRSADVWAYRALGRALDLDLVGAAGDLLEAIRLDPAEPAVAQVLEVFRGAACLGRERALLFARTQLALPPSIQLGIYEGQAALARGADVEAAVAFEGALGALDGPGVSAQAVELSLVRETLEILLAKAMRATAAADPAVRERMEALLADVERRHPTWPSPHYVRGGFAQKNGDVEAALAEFAKCRTMDPTGDTILQQQMPADAASLKMMCAVMEVTLLLMSKEGPRDPRMGPTLDRLEAALHGTSTSPVVGVLRDVMVVDGVAVQPSAPDASEALRAKFREVAKSLAATPPGSYGPAEALLRAMFHGMHVNAELMVGLDGVAEALAPLKRLAPRDDAYEAVWNAVATIRKETVMATFGRIFQDVDGDPRARDAEAVAVREPERARKMVDAVVAPVRASLARIGEPVLSFIVELLVRNGTDATIAKGMDARRHRIDRVLEVALDPAKVAKLESTKRDLVEQMKRLDVAMKEEAAAGRRALLATLATPVDMQTFQLVAAQIVQRDASAPIGVSGPDDARRTAELKLLAYLRVLSIPAPEGLK